MASASHQYQKLTAALLLAAAYFATGRLGLMLPAFGLSITLIWLPTGLAVAGLLRWGIGCWPGIWLGAFAVNLAIGLPWPVALAISVGNTLGPLLAAAVLRRADFHPAFDRARDILLLASAATLGMLVTSGGGVLSLTIAGMLAPAARQPAWLTWWAGDALGVIAAAPLLLTFTRAEVRAILRRRAEFLIWIAATVLAAWAVFVAIGGPPGEVLALAFVPLPLVAWAALRFGPVGTSLGLIIVSVGAAYGTATQRGPFSGSDAREEVAVLWLYMATSAVLGWLISALHQARVQATGLQRLLEQALSDVSLGVLLTGLDQRVTYANHGFTRLTGYAEQEARGISLSALHGPETDPAMVAKLKSALLGDGCFDGEMLHYRKDGTTFWNGLFISPVRDEDGATTGFLAITRDITQRRRAAAELERSLSTLQLFINSVPAYISLVDAEERYRLVNQRYEEYFGQPAASLVGRCLGEVLPPADYAKIQPHVRAALTGEAVRFQTNPTAPDGRSFWFDVQYIPRRDEAGAVAGFFVLVFDITERKAAEEALRQSEARYRKLFNANPHPMWVNDMESLRFIDVNESAIRHYGYSREEFLAMTTRDIRPPEDIPALLDSVHALTADRDHIGTWRHRKRDGSLIDVEVAVHPIDFEGRRAGVVLAHDITERRRSETRSAGERAVLELLASNAPLSAVLDRLARSYEELFPGMLCSVLLLDADGRHLRHGAAPSLPEAYSRAIDGVEIGPHVGSCGTAAFTRQTTEVADIATDPRWADYRDLALAHGLRACWSVPVISAQDRVLGTLALYYHQPASPQPAEIAAIERGAHFASLAIERHELLRSLQESQLRLETLVGNLPGMAYRCQNDPNWTMHYVSDGCESVTDYTREDLENNRRVAFGDLVHPDDRDWLWTKCQASLDAHAPCQNEYRIIDKQGRERWVSERASGVYADDGTLRFIDGFIQDITAQRQAQIEREQLDRKVQETQKLESLGVLAGGIAHDFNNLLTSILGNASIATIELPPGSSVQDCLEQINEAALRAADLCKQMLAYSGRGRFVVQKLDLGQLVEQTTQMLHISISKKAALRFRLEKELPPVEVDATQIRQVIMNLVINASEAIGDHSGVISISTGLTRVDRAYLAGTLMDADLPEGEYVYLEVSDTGAGMSAETQARIFDPFFTTKFTGRGLGLAAVLGIVRGHKGAMKVYSEVNRGTTFKLLFPATAGSGDALQNAAGPLFEWHGHGTVLVVDDEENMRATIARMMRKMGLDAVFTVDGQEALDVFRATPEVFSLVLLDLTMPHLDGEQTFPELRRLRPDVRVVLMSGFNAQEAMLRFSGKGLSGFLQKPFTIEALSTTIREVLSAHQPAPPDGPTPPRGAE